MYEKEKQNKSESKIVQKKNNGTTLVDNRLNKSASAGVAQRAVIQFGGGSYYWRKQSGGKWIYCGKYNSHAAANKTMKSNGWTNGNGWQFSQGGKNNPPGT
ncbi:MAG: hypothetical protein ACI8ZM_005365 [Crocinitomix sp.]|jgi:hypothetical protein